MKRRIYIPALAVGVALVLGAIAAVALASPPSGVTPTVLARGTYDAFKVRSYPQGPGDFKAEAKAPIDMVVRKHDYAIGSYTGWHSHPGPVFITVTLGRSRSTNTTTHLLAACRDGRARLCGHGPGSHRAQRVRPARTRHQRDHRAGGRCVPRRARRSRALLQLLSERHPTGTWNGGADSSRLLRRSRLWRFDRAELSRRDLRSGHAGAGRARGGTARSCRCTAALAAGRVRSLRADDPRTWR